MPKLYLLLADSHMVYSLPFANTISSDIGGIFISRARQEESRKYNGTFCPSTSALPPDTGEE